MIFQNNLTGTPSSGVAKLTGTGAVEIEANAAGMVGGFNAGNLMVKGPGTIENSGVSVTGHTSENGNRQKWWFGNTSAGHNNVGLINREVGDLEFWTSSAIQFTVESGGNIIHKKFTSLGSANTPIKITTLTTGNTNTMEGGEMNIGHGLTSTKILGVQVLVEDASGAKFTPGFTDSPGLEYNVRVTSSSVSILNHATNSQNILGKPFSIVVTYKE